MLVAVRPFILILILFSAVFCISGPALADDQSLPVLKLSEIRDQNISDVISQFDFGEGELPQSGKGLDAILETLPRHGVANPLGDRFVFAFTVLNDTPDQHWFVYPYGSAVEHIEIYQYIDGKLETTKLSGLNHEDEVMFHQGGTLKIGLGQQATILILLDSNFFLAPIKVVLKTQQDAASLFGTENVIMLLSLGVCLALGIYNCFLYIGTGLKQYLYYALSTFGFTYGWAYVFGVIRFLNADISPISAQFSFAFALFFISLFTSAFLQLKVNATKSYHVLRFLGLGVLSTTLVALFNVGLAFIFLLVFSSGIIVVSLYTGIVSWRHGYIPARYYVIALLSVAVPNMIGNLINLNLLPGININVFLMAQLGNSFDSLLLAFALAEQVRLTNVRNSALTHKLELNVQERTFQLSDANTRLENLIVELREANLAKNHFLASMSHEIRTPLTSIIGYAQSIQRGEVALENQPRVINIISDNGNHLLSVINDILDISKIEANKLEFELIPTPLLTIVSEIESVMSKRALDKGLELQTHFDFPLPEKVISDPTRLKQILFNLTNNALKFTEVGKVSLSLSTYQGSLIFKVSDTGIGMSKSQIESLFMPFQQAERSTSRKYGGTGLGLSISKHLAEGLGGKISVTSKLNLGTEFVVEIPFQPVEHCAMVENLQQFSSINQVIERKEGRELDFDSAKVLVVDDHPDIRELITLLLNKMGCQVVAVSSGYEALEVAAQQRDFKLVLLDIQMPEFDGMQTLVNLRALGCKVPVIALTANNTRREIDHYLELGFSAYLAKPVDREDFSQTLAHYLQVNLTAETVIHPDEQYELATDYYQTLVSGLDSFFEAVSVNDVESQKTISHKIKGSATSFGYDLFADAFDRFEVTMGDSRHNEISQAISRIQALASRYVNVPLADIAKGIVNHQNSLEKFDTQLQVFLGQSKDYLQSLKDVIETQNMDQFRPSLYKFFVEVNKYALEGLTQHLDVLEEYLGMGNQDMGLYTKQIDMMSYKLAKLQQRFN